MLQGHLLAHLDTLKIQASDFINNFKHLLKMM